MKTEPLAWYIAGPLIGLIVPILLLLKEKQFGISSSYRFIWAKINKKQEYFNYNEESDRWQFHFVLGLILTGLIYSSFGYNSNHISTTTLNSHLNFYTLNNWIIFLVGGIFIGFGSRYANGCTAGHCIMGLSQFSLASLIATIAFFVGGIIATYIILPFFLS
jgi:uncharacterized membrane protein YedE/YeeE